MASRAANQDHWRGDRIFLVLAAVSLIVKIFLVFKLPRNVFLDEWAYREIALKLRATGTYPTLFRPPLYPALVALSYAAGLQTVGIRLLQVVLSTLTAVPVYRITTRNYGEKAARISSALVLFNPVLIMFSTRLWSETVFILLQMIIIDLLTLERPSIKAWGIAGFAFGLAALTRPVVLTTLPVILLWTLLQARRDGRTWKRWSVRYATLVGACFLVIAPWTIRNARATGEFVLIDTNGPFNVLVATQPDAAFIEKDDWWTDNYGLLPEGFYERLANEHPSAAQAEALAMARRNLAADPGRYVVKSFWEAGHLWTADSYLLRHLRNGWFAPRPQWQITVATVVWVVFFVALVLAGIAGLAAAPPGQYRGLALLLLVQTTVFFGLVYSLSRYLVPLHPLLAISAAAALIAIRPTLREIALGGMRRRLTLYAVVVALATVWASDVPKLLDMVATGGSHYRHHRSEHDDPAKHPGDPGG